MDTSKQFVNQFFMLLKTAQIHEPGNRAFQHPLEQFRLLVEQMIESDDRVRLEAVDVNLYLNEQKIRSDISTFATFRYLEQLFDANSVGGVLFNDVPTAQELTTFVRLFVESKDGANSSAERLNESLNTADVASIEFLPKTTKKSVAQKDANTVVNRKRRALKNYVKAIDVIRGSAMQGKRAHHAAHTRKAKRVVYDLVDICLDEGFSFVGLSNIKNYDEYTFNHSVNVCIISIAFGKNLGLSKKQIGELGIAGLYHDYGKTQIPQHILNKPGRFNSDEWEVMKTHPLESIKGIIAMEGGFQEIDIKKMIAAFEHHRNYDCTGYPQTGVQKELSFYSRVVAIADAYDAMTTNRVYQRGMLPTVALKILMDNAGTKFDPVLVKAFVNTVGIYPVGSLVRLSTGALAIVTEIGSDPMHMDLPVVKVVANPQGQRLEDGPSYNLSDSSLVGKLSVEALLRPEEYNLNVNHFLFGDAVDEMAAKN